MKIGEGNKLIAEFMEWEQAPGLPSIWIPNGNCPFSNKIPTSAPITKGLCFNKSWDWLIPVVEKIESINARGVYTVYILQQYCAIKFQDETDWLICETEAKDSVSKIDAVWQTVIKFIKQRNESNSSL